MTTTIKLSLRKVSPLQHFSETLALYEEKNKFIPSKESFSVRSEPGNDSPYYISNANPKLEEANFDAKQTALLRLEFTFFYMVQKKF